MYMCTSFERDTDYTIEAIRLSNLFLFSHYSASTDLGKYPKALLKESKIEKFYWKNVVFNIFGFQKLQVLITTLQLLIF